MGLHGRSRVIQSVCVLRGLALKLALVAESASTTVTEKPVVADELYIVAHVAVLDAVDTDGIPLSSVACPAPVQSKKKICFQQTLKKMFQKISPYEVKDYHEASK